MNSNPGFKRKTLTALIGFAVVGLAGQAQAGAIAFSSNDVNNFWIRPSAGTLSLGGGSLFTSAASATLTTFVGVTGSDPMVNAPSNVPQQALGVGFPGEDTYTQTPPAAAPPPDNQFSRGDAIIDNIGVLAGTGSASNVAETQLNTSGTNGTNIASNILAGDLVLSSAAVITFSFDALPFMENFLSADAAAGSATNASLAFSISLLALDANGNPGATVFSWSPDGTVALTALATELTDDASLNTTIDGVTPGTRTYDPLNGIGGFTCIGTCNYSASTVGALAAGNYELSVSMVERSDAAFVVTSVPEPATLALLGLGLVGLGISRRRKAAV